jgi:hypothetical protein
MQTTHRVDLKIKPGDIDRQFQQARKRYLANDDAALLSFQAQFPENEYVQQLVDSLRHERAEIEYRAWLANMNPMGGCA